MERAVGIGLSDVTVGESQSAADMGAIAYTQGKDVRFAPGQLDTSSREGLQTLGHELAHVKQQASGGVAPTTQAKGWAINDDPALEADADRVGRAAADGVTNPVAMTAATGAATVSAAPVQRKVYIKRWLWGWREKSASKHPDVGLAGRTVDEMIASDKDFYFRSKDEMNSYARKETTHIGYVDRSREFIRLHATGLVVLGENHKNLTLADIVTATGTDAFRYEGFTGSADQADNPELEQAMSERKEVMDTRFGTRGSAATHEGESFLPKLARAVAGVAIQGGSVLSSEAESIMLRQALLYAAQAQEGTDLRKTYDKHAETFASGIEGLKALRASRTSLATEEGMAALAEFKTVFHAYYMGRLGETKAKLSQADQALFDAEYDRASNAYGNRETDEAEEGRDLSMLAHILEAQAAGDLLFGLGEIHRQRMADILESKGIEHMTIEQYIARQREP